VPFRYDGPDAATLAGEFAMNKAMVVEVNGQARELPRSFSPVKVRPGLLRVGVQFNNVSGQLLTAECFEIEAAPGSYYQFTSTVEAGGFLVYLHEGKDESRKLIGKAFVPFRRWMEPPQYCPAEKKA
jgi:hypothetical protein